MSNQFRVGIVIIFFLTITIGAILIIYQFMVLLSPIFLEVWYKFFPDTVMISSTEYDQPQKLNLESATPEVLGEKDNNFQYETFTIPRNYDVGPNLMNQQIPLEDYFNDNQQLEISIPILNLSNIEGLVIINENNTLQISLETTFNITSSLNSGDIIIINTENRNYYAEVVNHELSSELLTDDFGEVRLKLIN